MTLKDRIEYPGGEFQLEPGYTEHQIREALSDVWPGAAKARVQTRPGYDVGTIWTFTKPQYEWVDGKLREADDVVKKSDIPTLTEIFDPVLASGTFAKPPPAKRGRPKKTAADKKAQKTPEVEPMTKPAAAQPVAQEQALVLPELDEGRMATVMRGMKDGALKGAFDAVIKKISGPIAEKIAPAFKDLGPNAELLIPAVELGIEFCFMLGIAEAIAWLGPMMGKALPGGTEENATERSRLMATWMRKYAGEKFGQQVVESAIKFLPLIMAGFAEFTAGDFKTALGEKTTSTPEATPAKVAHRIELD